MGEGGKLTIHLDWDILRTPSVNVILILTLNAHLPSTSMFCWTMNPECCLLTFEVKLGFEME